MSALRPLSEPERLDWLRLFRTENIGPITFYRLLHMCGTAHDALERAPAMAKRAGGKALSITPRDVAEKELEKLHKMGGFMLAACEPDYPDSLRAIEDAPPVISVLGNRALLQGKRCVAVVGARNASLNARNFAQKLANDCGQAGLAIVSGLARGIDTAAHHGALSSGTMAVVAGGIDVVYPEENKKLYDGIIEKGLVIAESPFGTAPTARHFPKRNRIISGLSEAVLVVEAADKSGSLITARCALEQGREVMAVPGSPLDPRAKGSNNLLREGAALVESVQDVLAALSRNHRLGLSELGDTFHERNESFDEKDVGAARERLLEALSPTPTRLDDIIRDSKMPVSLVLAALLELELAGKAERQAGQMVALIG